MRTVLLFVYETSGHSLLKNKKHFSVLTCKKTMPRLAKYKYGDEPLGYRVEELNDGYDLSIKQIETAKDNIDQPALAKNEYMFIPPLGSSVIMSGKSGCGKSTLLANLIRDPRFYGQSPERKKGWFDKIFLFSPTANGDDIQRSLGIPKEHVFTELEDAPELLKVILDSQQKKIDSQAADKVSQFAVIFDDVIGDTKFMTSKEFTRCFYQVRHVNCTTFICTQHFKRVPRVCRLQANFVFFFQGSANEVEVIVDEYAPPMYSKNEFRQLISDTTKEKFSFLTINMKVGWDLRFRRNLDGFVVLDRMGLEQPTQQKRVTGGNEKKQSFSADSNKQQQEEEELLENTYSYFTDNVPNEQTTGPGYERSQVGSSERAHGYNDSATRGHARYWS